MSIVAVTGSTGALGGMTARLLADAGVEQRLIVRDTSRAPVLAGATTAVAAYGHGTAAALALAGVDVLFMVSASESADRMAEHRSFIEAATEAGVGHIVYTSFVGASPDCTFTLGRDHYATEQLIRASGASFTFLRDNFYLDFMEALVGDDGVIRGPAGDGRAALVARADIARVAAEVVRDPSAHVDTTYDMTGPEAIDMTDVARIISAARGREVTFHDETIPEAHESRAKWNAPSWQVDAWITTYTAIRAGELAAVSSDIETLTGRPPLTLAELLREP
ncbi:SDR family oxidoreductase [Amnibacterium flavum]|uniref:NAD(P)-dependent oxidoreductase n=1 Tax=Amnibacterium flavum TaxID=2173173 RepID=A0A2V1HPM2_9MICO|nr:SDR family oxidoreductase [Amnibacterium flavum]PVZ94583.1 NAD(P)-dependent oxidoreductase [Amnibacterium flavum]